MEGQNNREQENVGKKTAYTSQVGNTKQRVEVKADYSKKVRSKVDNVTKRNKFKKKVFDGKKTTKDPYTNQTLHSNTDAARAKYGSDHVTKHTGDVDHTMPLEKVYEKTKDNPFLTTEDIKKIANQKENYKVINSSTNRSKGSQSNKQYIKKNSDSIGEAQKAVMKKEQQRANAAINKEITKTTLKNANKIGMDAAKTGAAFGGGISAAQNLTKVVKGKEDLSEAAISVALDTAKAGAASYGTGVCSHVIEGAVQKAAVKTTSKKLASGLTKFVDTGGPAKAIVVVMEAGTSVVRYAKGEINEAELVYELGEKGTGLAVSFAAGAEGAVLGAGAGAFIGGVLGSVLPGAGTAAGAVIGAKVGAITGEIIGNIAGYMIGTEAYRRLADYMSKAIMTSEDYARLERMYGHLADDLKKRREELELSLEQIHGEHRQKILSGFEQMRDAIVSDDVEGINRSLNSICEQFGGHIAFETRDEFDAFMMNPDSVVRLGSRNC